MFGVSAEPLLGSAISETSLTDPNLDSQNRFYGAAFSLFGVVWWFSSNDIPRYQALLAASYLVFFIAGISRIISVFVWGLPSIAVLMLLLIELILPPIMYIWLRRSVHAPANDL